MFAEDKKENIFHRLDIDEGFSFRSRLKSLAPLLQLTHLRSLCLIDRENNLSNPLCNSSSYQQDVKNNLPNLGMCLISKERERTNVVVLDTLDNEWLGQGFQEHLSTLQSTIEDLERPKKFVEDKSSTKPMIIITEPSRSDQSIRQANEEYEQFLQSLQMLVK